MTTTGLLKEEKDELESWYKIKYHLDQVGTTDAFDHVVQ